MIVNDLHLGGILSLNWLNELQCQKDEIKVLRLIIS